MFIKAVNFLIKKWKALKTIIGEMTIIVKDPSYRLAMDTVPLVCKIPLLARRTRPSAARDDRVSCIQQYRILIVSG